MNWHAFGHYKELAYVINIAVQTVVSLMVRDLHIGSSRHPTKSIRGSEFLKVLVVVGTRPEAIKMAPVILALRETRWAEVNVVATAQHREMLDQVLDHFGIVPDIDLNVMRQDQTLDDLTSRLLSSFGQILRTERPSAVLAQGDTTTVLTSALSCFYNKVPFGHVEAGLRTVDINSPFPEEANRRLTGLLARWHFAPTERERMNLLEAGANKKSIFVTGNTVIDALLATAKLNPEIGVDIKPNSKLVLITAHRRENFGNKFINVCKALIELANLNPEITFLYPVHPNPNVRDIAYSYLQNRKNILLSEPLEYPSFVAAMLRAHIIITDSGGIQEEAPAIRKPVLVLRNETERPEVIESGVARLVGTDQVEIVKEAQRLIDSSEEWGAMITGVSPYGVGDSAEKIVKILEEEICISNTQQSNL